MNNKDITALQSMNAKDAYNILKDCTVEELEKCAFSTFSRLIDKELSHLLYTIMSQRKYKINSAFEWTDENRKKFLEINNKFMKVFESGYNEAVKIALELDNRINNGDYFIKDFELELKITAFIVRKEDDKQTGYGIHDILNARGAIIHHISHNDSLTEKPIELDKSYNWNVEYFDGEFDDVYICREIKTLLDSKWSFQDIINIDRIWTDIDVIHQSWEDV